MKEFNINKTQEQLCTSYLNILASMADEKSISVTSVCKQANISKSTFYLHFKDIFECADMAINLFFHRISNSAYNFTYDELVNDKKNFPIRFIELYEEYYGFFRKYHNSPFFTEFWGSIKKHFVLEVLENSNIDPETNYDKFVKLTFIVNGIADTLFVLIDNYNKDAIIKAIVELTE